MTPKIAQFLTDQNPATPCLVLDVPVLRDAFRPTEAFVGEELRGRVRTAGVAHAIAA